MNFSPTTKKTAFVISESEFREIFEREKARAERYGSPLSIVEFRASEELENERLERLVREVLARRLRETDHVGWTDSGSIAALLPDTDRAGASKLASELQEWVREKGPLISVAVNYFSC